MSHEPLDYATPATGEAPRMLPRKLVGAVRLVALAIVLFAGAILAGLGAIADSQHGSYGSGAFAIGYFLMIVAGIASLLQLVDS